MELTVDELNELLQREFERGRNSNVITTGFQQIKNPLDFYTTSDNIPAACKTCSNHPSNGGSGICHCTLGLEPIRCYTTNTTADLKVE